MVLFGHFDKFFKMCFHRNADISKKLIFVRGVDISRDQLKHPVSQPFFLPDKDMSLLSCRKLHDILILQVHACLV